MSSTPPRIAVLGSINMDLVVRSEHLPAAGETIMAETASEFPGGKGANQAVAAARCGSEVAMVGRIGDDAFADRLLRQLAQEGIDTSAVQLTENCSSGLAIVSVDSRGENSIVVIPGANAQLSPSDVAAAAEPIQQADVLLVQLEVPLETVMAAMLLAKQHGVRVLLDPAPAPLAIPAGLLQVDAICPNRAEASAIIGQRVERVEDAREAVPLLHALGAANVMVTLGGSGVLVSDGQTVELIEPFPIRPVDCTAAGDAFAGAFAVRWAEGASLLSAARFASVAGAIAATRRGAQPAMPSRQEIEQLFSQVMAH